jgi:choline dehydrogenase-like flavoprotein
MIVDLNHSPPPDAPQDVLIVGGGTVALLLAVLLERQGQRVLVLESGGGGFEAPAQALNEASVIGRAHKGIAVARGRALGGTSNLWGGQLTGFVPADFEAREGVSDAPWPIGYEELRPWYEAVARELRLADALDEHTPQARKLFGEGFPDIPGFTLFLTRWLKEPAMARYFSERLQKAPGLTVLLHAHATGLELTPDGESACCWPARRNNRRRPGPPTPGWAPASRTTWRCAVRACTCWTSRASCAPSRTSCWRGTSTSPSCGWTATAGPAAPTRHCTSRATSPSSRASPSTCST